MEKKHLLYALLIVTPASALCWGTSRQFHQMFDDWCEEFFQQSRKLSNELHNVFETENKEDAAGSKEPLVWDNDVAKSHAVTVHVEENKGYTVHVSNVCLDSDEVNSHLANGILDIIWKQKQGSEILSRGKLRIGSRGYEIAMDNKLTRETKDHSGNVLSSSSYRGYSHSSRTFDQEVDVEKATVESHSKSNELIIFLPLRDVRKNVEIKKISHK